MDQEVWSVNRGRIKEFRDRIVTVSSLDEMPEAYFIHKLHYQKKAAVVAVTVDGRYLRVYHFAGAHADSALRLHTLEHRYSRAFGPVIFTQKDEARTGVSICTMSHARVLQPLQFRLPSACLSQWRHVVETYHTEFFKDSTVSTTTPTTL